MPYNENLNKMVDKFMLECELNDITEKKVCAYFGDNHLYNRYGNIYHALVHHKYHPEKVFKMLELYMKIANEKININHKGSDTGYNFIQLALYGYTVDRKDFSYTTDFILELIKLAKKYNLDVNTTDNDGDTIIHTAIASEVYTGKIIPLLKELGPSFDVKKKDNNGNNIYEALLYYKKEAQAGGAKTKKWLERLSSEEKEIKIIVEKGNFTLENIDVELDKIKVDLEVTLTTLDGNLFNGHDEITKNIKKLNYFLEKRNLFDQQHTIYHDLEEKINKKIITAINEYLKTLITQPTTKKIEELETFLQTNSFIEELEILKELKVKHTEHIKQLKSKINSSSCLADLAKVKENLDQFDEDVVKQELFVLIAQREKDFNRIIENIKDVTSKMELIENWSASTGIISFEKTEEQTIDFAVLNEKNLLQYYQNKLKKLEKCKKNILTKFGELVMMVGSYVDLTCGDVLTIDELQGVKSKFTPEFTGPNKKKVLSEEPNGK